MVMRMAVVAAMMMSCVAIADGGASPTLRGAGGTGKEMVVKETIHGVEISDPYRWLEGDETGKATAETKKWTEKQNARTRQILDHLPAREKLEARLGEVMQMRAIRAPEMAQNRYFYTKREGTRRCRCRGLGRR